MQWVYASNDRLAVCRRDSERNGVPRRDALNGMDAVTCTHA